MSSSGMVAFRMMPTRRARARAPRACESAETACLSSSLPPSISESTSSMSVMEAEQISRKRFAHELISTRPVRVARTSSRERRRIRIAVLSWSRAVTPGTAVVVMWAKRRSSRRLVPSASSSSNFWRSRFRWTRVLRRCPAKVFDTMSMGEAPFLRAASPAAARFRCTRRRGSQAGGRSARVLLPRVVHVPRGGGLRPAGMGRRRRRALRDELELRLVEVDGVDGLAVLQLPRLQRDAPAAMKELRLRHRHPGQAGDGVLRYVAQLDLPTHRASSCCKTAVRAVTACRRRARRVRFEMRLGRPANAALCVGPSRGEAPLLGGVPVATVDPELVLDAVSYFGRGARPLPEPGRNGLLPHPESFGDLRLRVGLCETLELRECSCPRDAGLHDAATSTVVSVQRQESCRLLELPA